MREVLSSAVCKFSVDLMILSIYTFDTEERFLKRTVGFPILSLTSFPRIFRVSSFKGFMFAFDVC